ncbi:MAG: AsmA family protein, partial [Kiloniellales bacterium]
LLEMAGRPLPSGSDLGVVDLGLRIAGDPGRFRVSELEGALGPVSLTGGFAVALDGAGPALSDLDVLIDAKHPDAGQLARLAGLTQGAPSGLGSLDLQARLNGGPAQLRLHEFEASVGPVQLSGAVDLSLDGLTPTLESYDLNVAARHPDLAGLAAGFGWGAGTEGGLGALDLTARVRGDRGRMQVEELSGSFGPVDLSGRISVELGGARPAFVADLETGDLPLGVLLLGMAGDGTSVGGAVGGADDSERWSRQAIDLAGLRTFDARVNLRAAALTHNTLRVDRVGLSADLTAGLLDLHRFTGTVHGGAVQLTGKVDLREEIAAGFAITAIEVDLGDLLRAQAGFDRISGPVFFTGDFTTRGESEAELISALAGEAEISGLLTFQSEPGEEAGSLPADLQGVTDLSGLLMRALGRDPVRLAGHLRAEAGNLRTEDTRLDGQPAYALTLATVDLPGWTLDSVTDIYERSTGQPLISSIAFGGPLDAPEVEHLELPPSPIPEIQEQLEPDVQEQPAPEVQGQPVPDVQEQSAPDVQEQPAPLVSETAAPDPAAPEAGEEAGAAAPSEAEPISPETAPQPASPVVPQPDDLLKDLLKLGG